jgi:hypothetical protein
MPKRALITGITGQDGPWKNRRSGRFEHTPALWL